VFDASQLVGDGITVRNTEQMKGSFDFWYDPIPAEFFEVGPVSKPTVQLFVNNLKAVCDSPDPANPAAPCFFMYNSSVTPNVTSVSSASSAPLFSGEAVTISGTNFGTDASQISITFGTAPCDITAISDTSISCTLGAGTTGTHVVSLLHAQTGLAVVEPTTSSLTLGFQVTNFFPTAGGVMGGSLIVISGEGFSTNFSANEVRIGEADCEVVSATPSEISCIVPPYTISGAYAFEGTVHQVSGTFDASITIGLGGFTAGYPFVYDWSFTPAVTGASPALVSSGRTTELSFPVSFPSTTVVGDIRVFVGSSECLNAHISEDGQIHCFFPRGLVPPYQEQVARKPVIQFLNPFGGSEYAHIDPNINVQFALRVTSISSLSASIAGGTILNST
jgi:hypothetical protein